MNNFEKIKQMSVDEMADFLDKESRCECCIYNDKDCTDEECMQSIKIWLLQEVENEQNSTI